ncbi:MAG: TMEM14 family protein [Thermosynechococcaceae cyanobacterium]
MTPGILAALLYGLLNIAGGVMGYVKSKSKISLIMGCFFGTVLVKGAIATLQGNPIGLQIATVVTGLLTVVFAIRWVKTKKLMPAGVMVGLGAISLVVLIFAG